MWTAGWTPFQRAAPAERVATSGDLERRRRASAATTAAAGGVIWLIAIDEGRRGQVCVSWQWRSGDFGLSGGDGDTTADGVWLGSL